jgi:hypothetical protein
MISAGLYADWRARSWAAQALAERPDGSPLTEQLLQLIWHHQRLHRDRLHCLSGEPIRILHPGFWNHEPGPDFRGAVIQFGDALARNGDVEVDLSSQGWRAHGHDQNPSFKAVILHVVWESAPGQKPLPTLELKPHLDAPVEELASWLRHEPRPSPPNLIGQCATPLRTLPAAQKDELLHQAAQVRLQTKARQLEACARQTGWEGALWDGLFGALGYKHNVWPMRRISEVLPAALRLAEPRPISALDLQARLLGISGLLPTDLRQVRRNAHEYLRTLWNLWWREREHFADLALPHSIWRLGSLRPANNPQRRLALAAHWLASADLPARLSRWFAEADAKANLSQSLLKVLQVPEDDFWSRHWSFHSAPMTRAQPLLGPPRVTDLAMNVILPWFWIRAVVGQNQDFQCRAEQFYFAWPKAEDNAVLRLARQRIFGDTEVGLKTAAIQQAVLQIVRDFCEYSNALCKSCQFPALVGGGGTTTVANSASGGEKWSGNTFRDPFS